MRASAAICALGSASCGTASHSTPGRGGSAGSAAASGGQGQVGTGASGGLDLAINTGGAAANGNSGGLSIRPPDPTLEVTVQNGVVTSVTGGADSQGTIDFGATGPAGPVSAAWSIDRGELGSLAVMGGAFVPNGNFSGVGVVSAAFGKSTATTTLTINLHVTQNGGSWDPAALKPGVGGIGGVGGEAPGGPVDDATRARLSGAGQVPASASELGFLYPYPGTVWPRGVLAPLLQWQTTHAAQAAFVHLTQKHFDFQGFYAGAALVREHVDQKAWQAATNGNAGDPLHVEVKIADAANSYGPITED